jgi:hypothetical protein
MEEVIVETGWVWRISGQSSSWGLLDRPLGRDFNCGMCGDLGGWGADLNYWTDLLGGTRRGERDKKTDLLGAGQKDRPLGSGTKRQTSWERGAIAADELRHALFGGGWCGDFGAVLSGAMIRRDDEIGRGRGVGGGGLGLPFGGRNVNQM